MLGVAILSATRTTMPRPIADDLRVRLLTAYERGEGSLRQLAARFGVSWGYSKKIRQQQLRSGRKQRVEPSRHGPEGAVTAAAQACLREAIAAQPDLTLQELRERLRQRQQVTISRSWMGVWVSRLGLRLKKSRCTRPSATRKKTASDAKRFSVRSARSRRRA